MSLSSDAVAALTEIATAHTDCTVTVTNGTASATGIRSSRRGVGELMMSGVSGDETEYVNVPYATIGDVKRGWGLKIDGVRVFVIEANPDNARALVHIAYTRKLADQS